MGSSFKDDTTLAKQGEIAMFTFQQDNLSDLAAFAGRRYGYALPGALTVPLGELTNLVMPSTDAPNQFINVDVLRGAPDLAEFSIVEYPRRNVRPTLDRMRQSPCRYAMIMKLDGCGKPDVLTSWESLMLVYGALQQSIEFSDLKTRDSNDPLEITSPFSFLGFALIYPSKVAVQAGNEITSQIVDVAAVTEQSCGTCSPYASGDDEWYALSDQSSGSPGSPSSIIGTTDGGSTYNTSLITTLTGAGQGDALALVGDYIVVVSSSSETHEIALRTGVFGSNPWSQVSSGYVGSSGPTCIAVSSPQAIYMGGLAGYVYLSTDITSGVSVVHDGSLTSENVNAIHAKGEVVLTGHDNNVLLLSTNGGDSFTTLTGPDVGNNITAVWVLSDTQFYVGTSTGELHYTSDAGTNWTQRLLPDQANITAINDIAFDEGMPLVGALVAAKSAADVIYRTFDGGRSYGYTAPTITNLSSGVDTLGAVAMAGTDKIVAGGEAAAGGDGVLVVAA